MIPIIQVSYFFYVICYTPNHVPGLSYVTSIISISCSFCTASLIIHSEYSLLAEEALELFLGAGGPRVAAVVKHGGHEVPRLAAGRCCLLPVVHQVHAAVKVRQH